MTTAARKKPGCKARKSSSKKPLRVLVTGSREYYLGTHVFAVLDAIHARTPIGVIINGGATGADSLSKWWAKERDVDCLTVRAEWDTYGLVAGRRRNQAMLDLSEGPPDLVVAFPGDKGTRDMINRATLQLGATKVFQARPGGPLAP